MDAPLPSPGSPLGSAAPSPGAGSGSGAGSGGLNRFFSAALPWSDWEIRPEGGLYNFELLVPGYLGCSTPNPADAPAPPTWCWLPPHTVAFWHLCLHCSSLSADGLPSGPPSHMFIQLLILACPLTASPVMARPCRGGDCQASRRLRLGAGQRRLRKGGCCYVPVTANHMLLVFSPWAAAALARWARFCGMSAIRQARPGQARPHPACVKCGAQSGQLRSFGRACCTMHVLLAILAMSSAGLPAPLSRRCSRLCGTVCSQWQ